MVKFFFSLSLVLLCVPQRSPQPTLTKLGKNRSFAAAVGLLGGLNAQPLSFEEKQAIDTELSQARYKKNLDKKLSFIENLEQKPQEEFAPQLPEEAASQSPASTTSTRPDEQTTSQNPLVTGSEEIPPPPPTSPNISRQRFADLSPLQRRRALDQIRAAEQEVGNLEAKTERTRRAEKINKILKEIIKMAATSETVVGLIYYIIKLMILEVFVHKDGPKVKKLQRQVLEKRVELERMKRQASAISPAPTRNF